MKVLITGANGFVGSHILDTLCQHGIPAAALLRPNASKRFLESHLPQLDVRAGSIDDPSGLDAALEGVTHVIHCAGCVKALRRSEFYEVNQAGTRRVVEAVNRRDGQIQRLVHISSLAAGGPSLPGQRVREEDPPRPVSHYGKSKLEGELEVRNVCRPEFVILRPPAVYGPRDAAFLPLFKTIRRHLRPHLVSPRAELSLVFVRDLAEAAVNCLMPPAAAGETFYVASPEIVSSHAFADAIAARLRTWTVPLWLPTAALWPVCYLQEAVSLLTGRPNVLSGQKYAELRAPGWVCDPGRLQQKLGFTCATRLEDGIAETLAWYQQQNWL